MIHDLFFSLGRMVRAGIIIGAVLTAIALMVTGAKVSGWFTDARQAVRASELDAREATIKAAETAALEKREADIAKRETALTGLAAREAAKVVEAQRMAEQAKAEAKRADDQAAKADRRATEAAKRANEAEAKRVAAERPAFVAGPMDKEPAPGARLSAAEEARVKWIDTPAVERRVVAPPDPKPLVLSDSMGRDKRVWYFNNLKECELHAAIKSQANAGTYWVCRS